MTVVKNIDVTKKLSKKELEMLKKAESMPPVFDDDSPELTDEQLAQFKKISSEKREERRKQTVTLRLSPQTLKKAKSLGKGYTSILSRILEAALADNELIKKSL